MACEIIASNQKIHNFNNRDDIDELHIYNIDGQIKPGSIPGSTKKIVLSDYYNHKILPGVFPSKLTHLVIGRDFNQDLVITSNIGDNESIRNFLQENGSNISPDLLKLQNFGKVFSVVGDFRKNDIYNLLRSNLQKEIEANVSPNLLVYPEINFWLSQDIEVSIFPDSLECIDINFESFENLLNNKSNANLLTNINCKLRVNDASSSRCMELNILTNKYFNSSEKYAGEISGIACNFIDLTPKLEFINKK